MSTSKKFGTLTLRSLVPRDYLNSREHKISPKVFTVDSHEYALVPTITYETPDGTEQIESEGPVSFHEGFVECTRIDGTPQSAMIPRERVVIIEG